MKRFFSLRRVIALVLAPMLLLLGWAMPSITSASAATQKNNPNAIIQVDDPSPVSQWDPTLSENETATDPYYWPVYDQLINFNSKGGIVPGIAESWTYSSGKTVLTLKLRPGLTFQDGSKLNAAAVVANLNRDKASNSAALIPKLEYCTSFAAPNATTVVIHLSRPFPAFLYELATGNMSIAAPDAFATLSTKPVGSGPYEVQSYTTNAATYVRWSGFYDKTFAKAKELVINYEPVNSTAVAALESGQLNMIQLTTSDYADILSLRNNPNYTVINPPTPTMDSILLNMNDAPLNNPLVRQAIYYALNRPAIMQALTDNLSKVESQPFVAGPGHLASLDNSFPYNPSKAESLLSQAGDPTFTIKAIVPNTTIFPVFAQIVQSELAQVGITVQIVLGTPASVARPEYQQGQYPMMINSQAAEPDPALVITNEYMGVNDPAPNLLPASLKQLGLAAEAAPAGTPRQTIDLQKWATASEAAPVELYIGQYGNVIIADKDLTGLAQLPYEDIQLSAADFAGIGQT